MASKLKIKVNGLVHNVTASLDTPLLYVLHNELHLHGPRFGCGLAQCGACSVLLDGKEIRSCVTPVAAVSGKAITTLEGMPALYAKSRGTSAAAPASLHPLQQAWIDVQVPHCGYCQNGMMIQAADLLATAKRPTEAQIRTARPTTASGSRSSTKQHTSSCTARRNSLSPRPVTTTALKTTSANRKRTRRTPSPPVS